MNGIIISDKGGMHGSVVVREHRAGDISFTRDERGRAIPHIESMKRSMSRPLSEHAPVENLVVSSSGYGRNLILRQMSGDTTYGIVIDSGAIGTGNTGPVDGNTGLETAVLSDIPVSLFELTNDVLIVSFFIADGDLADGTYKEFGMFIDGRLLSRVIISPDYVKGSGIDTTIEYTLTFST